MLDRDLSTKLGGRYTTIKAPTPTKIPLIVSDPVYLSYEDLRSSVSIGPSLAIESGTKLVSYGSWLFVLEAQKGVHLFDRSNSSAPSNIGFLNIPGASHMEIWNHRLWLDSYIDLLAFNLDSIDSAEKLMNLAIERRFEGVFAWVPGDLKANFRAGTLDSTKGVVVGSNNTGSGNSQEIEKKRSRDLRSNLFIGTLDSLVVLESNQFILIGSDLQQTSTSVDIGSDFEYSQVLSRQSNILIPGIYQFANVDLKSNTAQLVQYPNDLRSPVTQAFLEQSGDFIASNSQNEFDDPKPFIASFDSKNGTQNGVRYFAANQQLARTLELGDYLVLCTISEVILVKSKELFIAATSSDHDNLPDSWHEQAISGCKDIDIEDNMLTALDSEGQLSEFLIDHGELKFARSY